MVGYVLDYFLARSNLSLHLLPGNSSWNSPVYNPSLKVESVILEKACWTQQPDKYR